MNPEMYMEVNMIRTGMQIRIPQVIILNDLIDSSNPLERIMPSNDRRLILCGKIIIQLNSRMDDI